MIDFEKLAKVQRWEKYEGESWEDVFHRKNIRPQDVPSKILIDVVAEKDLENWAKNGEFNSLEHLISEFSEILDVALTEPINANKKMQEVFPKIYQFCVFAKNLNTRGKILSEATKIAEQCWYGVLATKYLEKRTAEIFKNEPCPEKYRIVCKKIQRIWGFPEKTVDGLRYFVCQTRANNHNPSLNKSLYFWGDKKKTGKTTVARALASVLNGGKSVMDGGNYESTFNKELQINDHDLPLAAQANCVILDEAMPKDSRKSYGRVKSMLTSATCSYNQKFGRITTIPVKRYYLYTSNDDISDFIQDDTERRFIQINMNRTPEQISFEKIYQIWLEFAQNCQPEPDWQEWYNSFDDVAGLERKEVDYFKAEIMGDITLQDRIQFSSVYTFSMKFFEDYLITGKPTRDEKRYLRKALAELFGEAKGYRWNRLKIVEVFDQHNENGGEETPF